MRIGLGQLNPQDDALQYYSTQIVPPQELFGMGIPSFHTGLPMGVPGMPEDNKAICGLGACSCSDGVSACECGVGYYSSLLRQRQMMQPGMDRDEMEQAAMGPYYGMGQDTPPAGTYPFSGSIRVIDKMTGQPMKGITVSMKSYKTLRIESGPQPTDSNGRRLVQYVYEKPENQAGAYFWEVEAPSGTEVVTAVPGKEVVAGIEESQKKMWGIRDEVRTALIAQTLAFAVLGLSEAIYRKTQKYNTLIFAANAISFGVASYFTFKTAVNNPSLAQVAVGGVVGTVNAFHALGAAIVTFAPKMGEPKLKSAFTSIRKSIPAVVSAAKA